MKPEQVSAVLGGVPHMTLAQGRVIGEFIVTHNLRDCLELGFCHGVSSACIAAALDEIGSGSLVTIDQCNDEGIATRDLVPNIAQVLGKLNLQDKVRYFFEPTSYLWRLMRMLEEDPRPRFDFCYIDGAHSWFVDGFAFFLVERLLRPGGWILFDDLNWTYAASESLKDTDLVRTMPKDERETPQKSTNCWSRRIQDLMSCARKGTGLLLKKVLTWRCPGAQRDCHTDRNRHERALAS
jgi:predicted O-methyltransferase YrrM